MKLRTKKEIEKYLEPKLNIQMFSFAKRSLGYKNEIAANKGFKSLCNFDSNGTSSP